MNDPLPATVQRTIGDKLYEKRKSAALEVEQLVKALAVGNQTARIHAIIDRLVNDYASSPQANSRKGGLLCLAATAVGLANHHVVRPRNAPLSVARAPQEQYLDKIIPPVLLSFKDQDSRVRYYSCEALYNVAKAARDPFMAYFNDVRHMRTSQSHSTSCTGVCGVVCARS